MASLTRCDVCTDEFVPGRKGFKVESTSDVVGPWGAQAAVGWDVCSPACVTELGHVLGGTATP